MPNPLSDTPLLFRTATSSSVELVFAAVEDNSASDDDIPDAGIYFESTVAAVDKSTRPPKTNITHDKKIVLHLTKIRNERMDKSF